MKPHPSISSEEPQRSDVASPSEMLVGCLVLPFIIVLVSCGPAALILLVAMNGDPREPFGDALGMSWQIRIGLVTFCGGSCAAGSKWIGELHGKSTLDPDVPASTEALHAIGRGLGGMVVCACTALVIELRCEHIARPDGIVGFFHRGFTPVAIATEVILLLVGVFGTMAFVVVATYGLATSPVAFAFDFAVDTSSGRPNPAPSWNLRTSAKRICGMAAAVIGCMMALMSVYAIEWLTGAWTWVLTSIGIIGTDPTVGRLKLSFVMLAYAAVLVCTYLVCALVFFACILALRVAFEWVFGAPGAWKTVLSSVNSAISQDQKT